MPDSRFPFSNFEPVPGGIDYEGVNYPTSEHAYQAAKFMTREARVRIAELPTPGVAKRRGREAPLPVDWERRKIKAMADILAIKFSQEPFRSRLLSFTKPLVEWNTWHDNEWGVCTCTPCELYPPGRNLLGVLLTQLRSCLLMEGGHALNAGS